MNFHYTIYIHAHNENGVLPRILLAFSRRQIKVQALQFFDLEAQRPADMQFEVDCSPSKVDALITQLKRIVEVSQVWADEIVQDEAMSTPARLAAI